MIRVLITRAEVRRPSICQAAPVTNLNDALVGIGGALRQLVGENIDLILQPNARAATVPIDPGQLEQTIMSLAVKARDAMAGGGKLIVSTADGEVDAHDAGEQPGTLPGRRVLLTLNNAGKSIDSEIQIYLPLVPPDDRSAPEPKAGPPLRFRARRPVPVARDSRRFSRPSGADQPPGRAPRNPAS